MNSARAVRIVIPILAILMLFAVPRTVSITAFSSRSAQTDIPEQ